MGGNTDRNLVERLSWNDVRLRIGNGAAAILPIGAAAKQHGFHLPMNTDRIQAEWLAARIADRIDALVWPGVVYGYYPAFAEYAGSAGLSAPVFEAMIEELARAIAGFGCRALFVLDTGISTIAPVDRALARLDAGNVLHLKIHQGPRYRRAAAELAEQSHGSHADELETSLMLALAPDLVDMSRAEASPSANSRDARTPDADGQIFPQLQPVRQLRRSDPGDAAPRVWFCSRRWSMISLNG